MTRHDLDELSAYALGAAGPDEATRVEAHLLECADCRVELAELRQVTKELDRLPLETFVHDPPSNDRALRRTLQQLRDDRGPDR